ncbi:hypothetical protein BST13_33435 [Mycobacterium aquaticum]|uniref:DUF2746 domain-containing protein n=2 Tax=Mycobacterium aquaticum TaxID=1927124 RepID=A0A1X0A4F5_9MYCO|nr:hypothetical protein BST13_33435 [Mycobacterium aquaticum]
MNWGEIDNMWAFLGVIAFVASNLVITIIGQRKGRERRSEDREQLTATANKVEAVSKKVDTVTADVKVVRGEVKNDHPDDENMRDQLDRMEQQNKLLVQLVESQGVILQEVQERQDDHGRDIRGLRTDMGVLRGEDRDIKREHTDLVRRLNAFIRREHPHADPL